ncbi:MAG: ABC transporter ATP-binding protein [Schwartzia sp.]|nr:ABC transporter ATP-binding protein [Schwartzia sp. (in: firmicutes)]
MRDGNIVEAKELVKRFTPKGTLPVTALDGIDLSLATGCLTAVIGPDGAGKTTLMRLIAGLLTPTEGTLRVLGMDVQGHEQEIQNRLSYMPQKFGLYEDLTIAENMTLYANLHGVPEETRATRFPHLLDMTGLAKFTGRLAGKLSGGMKQKLGLACTLVRSPDLLLLDEPTVGVDPLSRRELWDILQRLSKEEQLSIFVSTAYMDEAELCRRVYVMNHGRLLASGSPEELRGLARGRCYRMTPPAGVPMRVLQGLLLDDREHIVDAVPERGAVHFIRRENAAEDAIRARLPLPFEAAAERLEDGFMILLRADEEKNAAGQTEALAFAPLSLDANQAPEGGIDSDDSLRAKEAPIIEVRELVRKFGDFTAVDKTSFEVHRGEVFGLLGPNGAGKTTTFRMLCGLLPLTSGHLSVAGVNLRDARTEARANIGYVAQKFSLYGNLTVEQNLSFFGGAYGLSREKIKQRLEEILREFHLEDYRHAPAESLPGGYKQRLSMAAALLHQPRILFLDEPTSGIDPLARRDFWRQITDLAVKGTTIIVTTHFMEEAEYCDRIMIQDQGKLRALGTPADLRAQNGGESATMNEVFIRIVEKAREKGGAAG